MPATNVRSQMPSSRSVMKIVDVMSVARKKIILKAKEFVKIDI